MDVTKWVTDFRHASLATEELLENTLNGLPIRRLHVRVVPGVPS